MTIVIQPFFVLDITETFSMKKLSHSLDGDALDDFLLNLRKEFKLQVAFQPHEASLL
jgi:hypothetical protein